ncbi:protein wnt [Plakobranchus ocellatus]|uniref:Protein Wnt n=1 Tax=Plakobranchus ocellatus TaxID=259542 RepID=A0AAV4D0N3_9GAST|nr:protein wnt [Plakobranchus ocellatus]
MLLIKLLRTNESPKNVFDDKINNGRAVGSPLAVVDSSTICRKTRRLAGRQRKICRREPEIVAQVAQGARLALIECQWQFQSRKWNCSTAKRSLSRILRRSE